MNTYTTMGGQTVTMYYNMVFVISMLSNHGEICRTCITAKTRVNRFIHTPVWRALSQTDCRISGVNQSFSVRVIEWIIMIALKWLNVADLYWDHIIWMVTIKPTDKHEGLSWVAGGAVIMGNMVYEAYVLHLKWQMGWFTNKMLR